MGILRILTAMVFTVAACLGAQAQAPQPRIALVIGQSNYAAGKLPTALNDAGIIAQALNDSGFEIVEGSDLDLTGMRQLIQDFLERVEKSGPDTAAAVYISGYAAQLEGDNYLLPVDARIARESDIAMAGFRLTDLIRSLNAATNGTKVVIVDAPRGYPDLRGKGAASGLALVEPAKGMLIAYATAPGNLLPDDRPLGSGKEEGDYGIYARALADQIYQPGIEADELFKRVRMQVHETTAGVEIPWHSSALEQPFFFMTGEPAALPPARPATIATPEDAYAIAIESDTIAGYQAFLKVYPDHPLAKRIKVLLANRREAVFWNRTVSRGTAEAYWTYLKSYPKGPHVADARRRLEMLSRPVYPPEDFPVVVYEDIPPPIEIETVYETTYIYDDYRDYYDYPPPPPPPVYILPPWRPIPWQRPVRPVRPGFLPVPERPAVLPVPIWRDRPPPRVAPVVPGRPIPAERRPGGAAGRPDIGREPPAALPRPVERPAAPAMRERPRPEQRPAAPAMRERPRQEERPAAPAMRERPRPEQRPAAPAMRERQRPEERPSAPAMRERPRQVERPTAPAIRERQRPEERSSAPAMRERPRQEERSSAPAVRERPRQEERQSAPAAERQERQPEQRQSPPDRRRRPGEPQD